MVKVGDMVSVCDSARKSWAISGLSAKEALQRCAKQGIVVQVLDRFAAVQMLDSNGKPLYTTSVFYEDLEGNDNEHT